MAIDIYGTAVLRNVVANLRRPSSFLLDRYFRRVQQETAEVIHFDRKDAMPRLAPFVSPLVEGQIVERDGYATTSFKPAYVKPKRTIRPDRALKRMAGEAIGGSLSPQRRAELLLREDLVEMTQMVVNREEWMAAQALVDGAYVVEGENYAPANIDFRRDASLSLSESWADPSADVLGHLERWATAVQDACGAVATEVVMDTKAWRKFAANDDVAQLLDRRRGGEPSLKIEPITGGAGGVYARDRGEVGDFRIFVYQWKFVDEAGALRQALPDDTVLLVDPVGLEGVRAYGAIQDLEAGLVPDPIFFKSWVEHDPSARVVLGQSAPLVVPERVDASLRATVT